MALSEELKGRIRAEFPKYPEKRAVLLTALHWAQAEHGGWLPAEVEPEIAELLEISVIDVHEVVSFYSLFHSEPVGRFHLQVCVNLSCCLRGARGIVRTLEELLAIRSGEVSEDGLFSIGEVQCLGSCGTAPVLQVNNQPFLEKLSREGLEEILERLRSSDAAPTNGGSPRA